MHSLRGMPSSNRYSAGIDMRRCLIVVVLLAALSGLSASAQKFSLSTDLVDLSCLGTMNIEGSLSVSRRWSLTAGVVYNPFTYRTGQPERQFHLRQQAYSIGARLWPWHALSGWWFAGKLRYQEYSHGGIFSKKSYEGDRCGVGLYSGYTYMISRHFNVEFGVGLWAGADWFSRYSCTVCGLKEDSGCKAFILPDDLMIAIVYVF